MSMMLHARRLWQASAIFQSGDAPKRRKAAAANILIWLSLSPKVCTSVQAKARQAMLRYTHVAVAGDLVPLETGKTNEAP